jgi:hypothetical protein
MVLQNPRLKAMVVPREHGAWGMLLVPLATGAVVATAGTVDALSLALFVIAALAMFWLRTPVEAWLGTTPIKAQSREERKTVVAVSGLLALVAAGAIAALFVRGLSRGLLLIGAISATAFALQALVKRLGRSGRMPAQIIGAIGLTSTAAGAYYVCSGELGRTGLVLWLTNWLFAADQVHFVQAKIRGGRLTSTPEKLRQNGGFLLGQVLLMVAIGVLTYRGLLPRFTLLAYVPALVRGFAWYVERPKPLDVHKLGFSELKQALIFGVLLCAAFLV